MCESCWPKPAGQSGGGGWDCNDGVTPQDGQDSTLRRRCSRSSVYDSGGPCPQLAPQAAADGHPAPQPAPAAGESAEEEWAFAAGTVVAGEPRRFADGTHGIVAAALTERNLAFTERDLILDEVTALQVGLAILKAYYGPTFVARFEPYEAVFMDGAWAIMGDSPAHKEARREQERLGLGYFISVRGGGAPCVELSPRDGRVLRVNLAR